MRITTIATMGGSALLAAAVLALTVSAPPAESSAATPAHIVSASVIGSDTSTAPAPAPLTDAQKALIDSYLAAHPGRAQRLAATAQRWKTFADAHPELAAELAKVAALPAAQRKQELSDWFADHPAQKAAFRDWVKQTRADRAERRDDRRERRQDRREHRQDRRDGTSTPAPSTSSSVFTTTTSATQA